MSNIYSLIFIMLYNYYRNLAYRYEVYLRISGLVKYDQREAVNDDYKSAEYAV